MKNLVIIAVVTLFLVSCNSGGSDKPPKKLRRDTTTVLALYKSALDGEVISGFIKRVTLDTFSYFNTDNSTKKQMWGLDSFYLIDYYIPVDSMMSKRRNIPIRDSIGRQNIVLTTVATEKKY